MSLTSFRFVCSREITGDSETSINKTNGHNFEAVCQSHSQAYYLSCLDRNRFIFLWTKSSAFVILVFVSFFVLVLLGLTQFCLNQNTLKVQIFKSGTYSIKKPFTCLKI